MTTRMSVAEYRASIKKPSKYRAKPMRVDGIRFDSTLEADYYLHLKRQVAGEYVRYFLTQPSFNLPGNVRYRADFLVVENYAGYADIVRIVDCKGFITPTSKLKIKQVQEIYGITIEIITRGGGANRFNITTIDS